MTCIRPYSQSRIDRFYVNARARQGVREVVVVTPGHHSDHNGVRLSMDFAQKPAAKRRPKLYPITSSNEHHTDKELLAFIRRNCIGGIEPALVSQAWDEFSPRLANFMLRLRAPPPKEMLSQVTPNDTDQRSALIQLQCDKLAYINRRRHGQRIRRSDITTKAFYQRITDKWDNATIPHINAPAGAVSGTDADNMAATWHPLFKAHTPTTLQQP